MCQYHSLVLDGPRATKHPRPRPVHGGAGAGEGPGGGAGSGGEDVADEQWLDSIAYSGEGEEVGVVGGEPADHEGMVDGRGTAGGGRPAEGGGGGSQRPSC